MGKKMLAPAQVIRIEELLEVRDEWGRGKYTQEQIADIVGCSPSTIGRIVRRTAAYVDGPGNAQVQMERGIRMAAIDVPETEEYKVKIAASWAETERQLREKQQPNLLVDAATAKRAAALGAVNVIVPPSPLDGGDVEDETEGTGISKLFNTERSKE